MSGRRGDYCLTFTGRKFYPIDPRPEDVFIEDIAHALAHQCRFAGHTLKFYSVAQHSLLVSQTVPSDLALIGLLHDAAEAYVHDIIRPLKRELVGYKDVEKAWEMAIGEAFDLGGLLANQDSAIKRADLIVLATEKRDLTAVYRERDPGEPQPLARRITPWSPVTAEYAFLRRFVELTT